MGSWSLLGIEWPQQRTQTQQVLPGSFLHYFLPDMEVFAYNYLSRWKPANHNNAKISLVSWIIISQALCWRLAPGLHCCFELITFGE
jgi:hypothetical protein